MNETVLSVYHRMPPALRSLVAGARGLYLRSARYGAATQRAAAAALERDRWPEEKLRAYQQERLALVLHRAATCVPYYREQWSTRRANGDTASWAELENWPILEKDVVRDRPLAFLADGCDPRRMYREHTSGTTGKPLPVWWSRETVQAWYGLAEARWRTWYGVSGKDRWAILGGQLVVPYAATLPPYWVWNAPLRQLYLSSYHLAPAAMPHYLEALSKYRIQYLYGYTSALYTLAQSALAVGGGPRMSVVITNAEPLPEHQRRVISQAFQCPVRETYGMAEIVAAASECEAGNRHLWPEAGIVEILHGTAPAPAEEAGDLVATGLLNADMPLIRYRIGDRACSGTQERCPCGRTLRQIGSIEGRSDDVVVTPDGRSIGRLGHLFKDDLPLREAQIIQEHLDRFRILCVPAAGYGPNVARVLTQRLRDRVGDVGITVECVDEIPRGANGKFRAVISRVPKDVRDRATAGRY
ncbi:MAG: AMP-binding protein [Acidobacteriota bacterium]